VRSVGMDYVKEVGQSCCSPSGGAKDVLDIAEEVPPQELPLGSFVANDLGTSLQYEAEHVSSYPLRVHISIGEGRSVRVVSHSVAQ